MHDLEVMHFILRTFEITESFVAGLQSQRLQIESIQHLLQLLPAVHRDTLWHLLRVLVSVANNSKDHKDTKGMFLWSRVSAQF